MARMVAPPRRGRQHIGWHGIANRNLDMAMNHHAPSRSSVPALAVLGAHGDTPDVSSIDAVKTTQTIDPAAIPGSLERWKA